MNKKNIDVSYILGTMNRASALDAMLESLKESAKEINYEVIVIVGECSDNTVEILKKHNIQSIYHEKECLGEGRHSWAVLYNFGFSKARGKWAMWGSDDFVFKKNCLTNAVSLLNKQKPDIVGGIFFYKDIYPELPEWKDYGICFTLGQYLLMNYGLIRTDFYKKDHGLDESFLFRQGDADLSLRAQTDGTYLIPLPESFLIHSHELESKIKIDEKYGEIDNNLLLQKWRKSISADWPFPYRLMYQEEYKLAFRLPQYLPKMNPGIKEFWHAISWMQKKEFSKAIEKFNQALSRSCEHWIVYWYLAKAFAGSGNTQESEKALEHVNRAAPDFQEAKDLLFS